VRVSYRPTLRGLTAINRSDPASAIETLSGAVVYELGMQRFALRGYFGALYPGYVRGLAKLAERDGVRATAVFQKILDRPGVVRS
jgi:hypothetical protein